MSQEPTIQDTLEGIQDVLEAISQFSSSVDRRFNKIESAMVTKSYLDDKLTDLRGDLVVLARKGNMKLKELIDQLEQRRVLDHETAQKILALEPFPQ